MEPRANEWVGGNYEYATELKRTLRWYQGLLGTRYRTRLRVDPTEEACFQSFPARKGPSWRQGPKREIKALTWVETMKGGWIPQHSTVDTFFLPTMAFTHNVVLSTFGKVATSWARTSDANAVREAARDKRMVIVAGIKQQKEDDLMSKGRAEEARAWRWKGEWERSWCSLVRWWTSRSCPF